MVSRWWFQILCRGENAMLVPTRGIVIQMVEHMVSNILGHVHPEKLGK